MVSYENWKSWFNVLTFSLDLLIGDRARTNSEPRSSTLPKISKDSGQLTRCIPNRALIYLSPPGHWSCQQGYLISLARWKTCFGNDIQSAGECLPMDSVFVFKGLQFILDCQSVFLLQRRTDGWCEGQQVYLRYIFFKSTGITSWIFIHLCQGK